MRYSYTFFEVSVEGKRRKNYSYFCISILKMKRFKKDSGTIHRLENEPAYMKEAFNPLKSID